MGVIVQDSVEIIDFTDITDLKTWYITVLRTSSAPTVADSATEAQMTTNGWSTTEPDINVTKKLYTVQQCIFGDGTYRWGDVSLSSSYEAAIQAYNKAQTAQENADEAKDAVDAVQKELQDAVEGSEWYQYTTGGVTYDVWLEEDGKYYYEDANGDTQEVAAANLDTDDNGNILIVTKYGLADKINTLIGAVVIDSDEPSISIQLADENSVKIAEQKMTATRWELNKNGDTVVYIDADEEDGILDIENARIHDRIVIGNLELFNNGGNIGIRRYS